MGVHIAHSRLHHSLTGPHLHSFGADDFCAMDIFYVSVFFFLLLQLMMSRRR